MIIWALYSLIYNHYQNRINILEKEIDSLSRNIEEKNRSIRINSGIVFEKYAELAKFNKKQIFNTLARKLVDNSEYIDGVQIYTYSKSIEKEKVIIKINFEEGYASENIEINSIMQSYYKISLDIFKEIQNILGMYLITFDNKYVNQANTIKDNFADNINLFIYALIEKLNQIKDINEATSEDAVNYRILLIILSLLSKDDEAKTFSYLLINNDIEDKLIKQRTGILGSILLDSDYLFKHNGDNSKNGRLYYTSNININNEYFILLVSFPRIYREIYGNDNFIANLNNINILVNEILNELFLNNVI